MSDLQALHVFLKKSVSREMIDFLVATTNSVIPVVPTGMTYTAGYPTPPGSPSRIPSLHTFIERLVKYSHVPTSTLMSTLVYLARLREILPPNSVGMETTRHRIFLGALILAAKNLNDSSPLNKHWCKYTDGLLALKDVNALEMEMIEYMGWEHLRVSIDDLLRALAHFLDPIKWKIRHDTESRLAKARAEYPELPVSPLATPSASPTQPLYSYSSTTSVPSLVSSTSTSSILSTPGTRSNVVDLKPLKLAYEGKENQPVTLRVANPEYAI